MHQIHKSFFSDLAQDLHEGPKHQRMRTHLSDTNEHLVHSKPLHNSSQKEISPPQRTYRKQIDESDQSEEEQARQATKTLFNNAPRKHCRATHQSDGSMETRRIPRVSQNPFPRRPYQPAQYIDGEVIPMYPSDLPLNRYPRLPHLNDDIKPSTLRARQKT